ncbi:MAG: CBS domain-containing protein, partial [Cyanobacteria bacterium HKST-UBA03]|nr:CBS domain-containing protein [Cyanobacteria bacterium HKST-UBA03]
AHLRIEARFLPAGPTLTDEVANAAFFMGLMHAVPEAYGDIRQHLSFDDARANFFNAAQVGLKAQFNWLDGQTIPATQLILTELLPLAYKGLEKLGVDEADRRHYLGIIEARTRTGLTGAQWLLGSLDELNQANSATPDQKSRTLVKAMIARQQTGKPVHEWTFAEPCGPSAWRHSYQTVGQFMKTKLFTVQPDDLIDLATNMMDWKHISHIPVEDDAGQLHGIVTHTDLLHLSARQNHDPLPVKEIMKTEPITVTSTTSTRQAIELMRHYNISCLPVVDNNRLVGMITAHDILDFAAHVFDELVEKETV